MEETGTRKSLCSQNADWQLILTEEHLHRVLSCSVIKMSQAFFVHLWVSLDFSISISEATAHLSYLISWLALHPFLIRGQLTDWLAWSQVLNPWSPQSLVRESGSCLHLLLQMCSTEQKQQHLGTYSKCRFSGLSQTFQIRIYILQDLPHDSLAHWSLRTGIEDSSSSWKMPWAASQACSCGQC